ncbi:MAG: hypothetical protein IIY02_04885 [Firmicutes bacterium]|nr:hypothetical protein [Bacillota bacterium]
MNKYCSAIILFISAMFLLSGCDTIGAKSGSISYVYAVTSVLALAGLIGYCSLVKKKNVWFLLLFVSILIVNLGYFSLSISHTLEEALLANRVSYLGSVFLPMAMMMIILDYTELKIKKFVPAILLLIGTFVFLVAASPGYLDIYYKEVSLITINGISALDKTYGPWHSLYLFYLVIYFAAMIIVIIRASAKRKLPSRSQAVIIAAAVFINIVVWLIEQLVSIDFECLSVSYIISELFLLGLCLMIQENEAKIAESKTEEPAIAVKEEHEEEIPEEPAPAPSEPAENHEDFIKGVSELTGTEHIIYNLYLQGKTTKEIMAELNIKENTLKYHNKNIYGKLGVSSRKQLKEIAEKLNK